jgi:hypothetical protein
MFVNVLASEDADHEQEFVEVGVCFACHAVRQKTVVSLAESLFVEEQHKPVNGLQVRLQYEI